MQIKVKMKGQTKPETFEAVNLSFDAFGINIVQSKRTRVIEWRLFDSWEAKGKVNKDMQERSEKLHQSHIEAQADQLNR